MGKPTALGIYVFGGGFTEGIKKHCDVVAHLEDKPYFGTETCKLNHPKIPHYFRLQGGWPLEQWRGKINVVYCNPPCAIVSPIGMSMKKGADSWKSDPRINCWLRCFDTLDSVQPDMLWIESVPEIYSKARSFIDALACEAHRKGYNVTLLLHDGAHYGLPQSRKRFFFVAHRHSLTLAPGRYASPPPVGETLAKVSHPGRTLEIRPDIKKMYPKMRLKENGRWEAVRLEWIRIYGYEIDKRKICVETGREFVRGESGEWYEKAGKKLIRLTERPRKWKEKWFYRKKGEREWVPNVPRMPMFELHRLHKDFPTGACTGDKWLHPTEPRHLGIREYAAMCGYPHDYKFGGNEGTWITSLVQAVMPPVGAWVGKSSALTLERKAKTNRLSIVEIDALELKHVPLDRTDELEEANLSRPLMVPEPVRPVRERSPRVGGIAISHAWNEKTIKVLVKSNPRRPGSNTYEIFELYKNGLKVTDFIKQGGRYVDIKHDLERSHIALV